MQYPIEARIEQAIHELIATRDCCGDERGALRTFEADHGRFTASQRTEIRTAVEDAWRSSQRAAGVRKPIASRERAAIAGALESEPVDA